MDIQAIIVYIIFAICVICAIRWFVKRVNKKEDCGCGVGCPGCTSAKKDNHLCNYCANSKKKQN